VIETDILVPLAVRDPDDLVVLAAAFAARADVLVTQDKDLLDLRLAAEFAIMNVDEVFWTLGLTTP
jgi:predicted nucleic acid-binding protein